MNRWIRAMAVTSCAALATAAAAEPPSRPGVDAPALAALGEFAVGVRTLTLVHRDQPDVAATLTAGGTPTAKDRPLVVDLWYPALPPARGKPETYHGELTGEAHGAPVKFSVPGLAFRDAAPVGKQHPLVVVSHGAGNHPAALTWLTENLASKGYVVAAIHHEDPPYGDTLLLPVSLLRRPLDLAFVVQSLQASLAAEGLIDPQRLALVGYSMGGYGVLAAAGATLDPAAVAQRVPANLLAPFARGGGRETELRVSGLRAVVALAPAGGGKRTVFEPTGFAAIKVPLLLIVGDQDRAVGYAPGVRSIFEAATGADRYLLTFRQAGHAIGLNPAPEEMRSQLWDLDWFEDPVWRKDRINAINLHFITAFLDGVLLQDAVHRSYLDVPQPESDDGVWPPPGPAHWSDKSPATDGITVWKGFQSGHAAGLELEHRAATTP